MSQDATTIHFPSLRESVSESEWNVRVELAAAYRLVALFGWDDLVFTHISARVPGKSDQFLINPYGLFFEEITASSLIKINHVGEPLMDSPFQVNPAGFLIHGAIHESRPEVNCVMHTHTPHGIAVSAQRDGLLPISQQSGFIVNRLAYHDYEGVALKTAEKISLVRDLGDKNQMILRNHGLLTCGATVREAFKLMYTLDFACKVQILAQSSGAPLVEIPALVLSNMPSQSREVTRGISGSDLVWPGLLRRLMRQNPGHDT